MRDTEEGILVQIILKTLSLDDIRDEVVESASGGLNAIGAHDLVVDRKPLATSRLVRERRVRGHEIRVR